MNVVQIEIWQLITLLIAFFSCVAGFGKILMDQAERRSKEQSEAQEKARKSDREHSDKRFDGLERASREEAGQWQRVERDLLQLRAELPVHYVRREDYVRNQAILEAKLDAVFEKVENVRLLAAKSEGRAQ